MRDLSQKGFAVCLTNTNVLSCRWRRVGADEARSLTDIWKISVHIMVLDNGYEAWQGLWYLANASKYYCVLEIINDPPTKRPTHRLTDRKNQLPTELSCLHTSYCNEILHVVYNIHLVCTHIISIYTLHLHTLAHPHPHCIRSYRCVYRFTNEMYIYVCLCIIVCVVYKR